MSTMTVMMPVDTANANTIPTEGNGIIAVTPFVLILLGVCVGIVVLQVFLSKRKNRVAGFVIPIMLPTTLVGFLLFSIWGVVLSLILSGAVLAICSFCMSRRKKQSELVKMSVQDL